MALDDRPRLATARPCPFCGGTDVALVKGRDQDGTPLFPVYCHGCMTMGPPGTTEEEGRAKWEQRGGVQ